MCQKESEKKEEDLSQSVYEFNCARLRRYTRDIICHDRPCHQERRILNLAYFRLCIYLSSLFTYTQHPSPHIHNVRSQGTNNREAESDPVA